MELWNPYKWPHKWIQDTCSIFHPYYKWSYNVPLLLNWWFWDDLDVFSGGSDGFPHGPGDGLREHRGPTLRDTCGDPQLPRCNDGRDGWWMCWLGWLLDGSNNSNSNNNTAVMSGSLLVMFEDIFFWAWVNRPQDGFTPKGREGMYNTVMEFSATWLNISENSLRFQASWSIWVDMKQVHNLLLGCMRLGSRWDTVPNFRCLISQCFPMVGRDKFMNLIVGVKKHCKDSHFWMGGMSLFQYMKLIDPSTYSRSMRWNYIYT